MFNVFSIGWSCRLYCSCTLLFLLYTRLPCEASLNRLIILAIASKDGEQYGVETGAVSISKTTCLVAKKYKYKVLRAPCD